ncbi:MAG: hypothetical protein WAM62_11295, partial [Pseudolabrys sp.]
HSMALAPAADNRAHCRPVVSWNSSDRSRHGFHAAARFDDFLRLSQVRKNYGESLGAPAGEATY